jgi:Lon protease-like protein
MKLPLFPLRTVLFPGMLLPLHIFEPRYREMINLCIKNNSPFGVVLIHSGPEVGGRATPHRVGTSALIVQVERLNDGRMNIEAVGQERFRILAVHHDQAYLTGTVEQYPLRDGNSPLAERAAKALKHWLGQYLSMLGQAAETPFDPKSLPHDPISIAYLAAIVAQIPLAEKQALLGLDTAMEMLERERTIYRREVSLIRAMLNSAQSNTDSTFSPN